MKSAIFGGSFNPIHNGHLKIAEYVLENGYDKIIFVPSNNPPHKLKILDISAKHRLQMLKLAIKDFAFAKIWEGEFTKKGISYSIDTVEEMIKTHLVEEKPGFIVGDDHVQTFQTWKDSKKLASITRILLVKRIPHAPEFQFEHQKLDNPIWPYSSSSIRQKILLKESLIGIVPQAVLEYIDINKLYV